MVELCCCILYCIRGIQAPSSPPHTFSFSLLFEPFWYFHPFFSQVAILRFYNGHGGARVKHLMCSARPQESYRTHQFWTAPLFGIHSITCEIRCAASMAPTQTTILGLKYNECLLLSSPWPAKGIIGMIVEVPHRSLFVMYAPCRNQAKHQRSNFKPIEIKGNDKPSATTDCAMRSNDIICHGFHWCSGR